jgi:hypothetical protein
MTRFIRKIILFFRPIKKGEIFYGDPERWVTHRPIEMVLHGLKDKYGTTIYHPVPSEGCFVFTVSDVNSQIYVLNSEVFCYGGEEDKSGIWKKRTQPRKMSKKDFEEIILNGILWR